MLNNLMQYEETNNWAASVSIYEHRGTNVVPEGDSKKADSTEADSKTIFQSKTVENRTVQNKFLLSQRTILRKGLKETRISKTTRLKTETKTKTKYVIQMQD